jgi:hypothetical protein
MPSPAEKGRRLEDAARVWRRLRKGTVSVIGQAVGGGWGRVGLAGTTICPKAWKRFISYSIFLL